MNKKILIILTIIIAVIFGSLIPVHGNQLNEIGSIKASDLSNRTGSKTEFKLSTKSMVFDSANCHLTQTIWNDRYNTSSYIKKAVSSNKKVCTVVIQETGRYGIDEVSVVVKAINAGNATVTVTDNLGRKAKVSVKVTKGWRKAYFAKYSYLNNVYYSYKNITINGIAGSKITFKIGNDTYEKKVKKNSSYVQIKLKKHYKIGTNYKVIFKYEKLKKTVTGKVSSCTSVCSGTVWSNSKYVPITAYSVTTGDTLVLETYDKTYKKKVTSSAETYNASFNLDKNCGNYSWLRFKVINKYNQVLWSCTRYLNWR